MNSINRAVEKIVRRSDIPYFALQDGLLNLSAYAKTIQKDVQNECKKTLHSTGAIVMALSRLQKTLSKNRISLPKISVNAVTIKHNLSEVSIVKSPKAFQFIQKLLSQSEAEQRIHLVTFGLSQINIILQNMTVKEIKKEFRPYSPSAVLNNLASITMSISQDDVLTPNIFYTIFSKLAAQEINVIEITTAKLEQTIILEEHLLTKAYSALSDILENKEDLYQ